MCVLLEKKHHLSIYNDVHTNKNISKYLSSSSLIDNHYKIIITIFSIFTLATIIIHITRVAKLLCKYMLSMSRLCGIV